MPTIDHVLLTRFNLPSVGVESLIRAQDGWLRERVVLFERYCLPSVLAQTSEAFVWIIYFDPESPAWLMDKIEPWRSSPRLHPLFRTEVPPNDLVTDLETVTGRSGSELITTNLDNDDGVAVDFVERLQAGPKTSERTALYLADGLIKSRGRVYRRLDRHNAFCSVRETWNQPMTCWSDWHNLLGTHMPVQELRGDPGWLQVVHDTNVSNRVRGRLASAEPFRRLFPGLLDDVDPPGPARLLRDRLVEQPRRAVQESGRATVKALALRLFGKSGPDRLKLLIGSRRGTA